MNIAIEIVIIVLGVIVGCIYEEYDKFKEKALIKKDNKKNIGYFVVSMVFMIGLAIWLQYKYQNTLIHNIRMIALLLCMIPIALIDYKKHIIHNKSLLAVLVIRLVIYIGEFFVDRKNALSELKSYGLGVMLIFFFAIVGIFIIKNGFGMGDLKLMFVMVLYLGFSSVFASIFTSLIFTLIVAVILMLKKKKGRKDTLPFAPCLLMGTYISVLLTGM